MTVSSSLRAVARMRLDERLGGLRDLPASAKAPPNKGWIRAIREALGMPRHVLGQRMGVGAKRVQQMELGEASGRITMESLARAAAALDCEVVVALVPREPLASQVRRRRDDLVQDWIRKKVLHTMSLEGQAIRYADLPAETVQQVERMFPDARLWDDP